MVKLPDEFKAVIDSFQGPLDLLLYLVKKNEMDIFDIPIAQIVEQYKEFLRVLREIDVNLAGDYLVMATTLMEIKSRMLLPNPPPMEEDEEDPRLDLVRQLLEYKKYKERALLLAERIDDERRRLPRPVIDGDGGGREVDLGDVTIWDLLTAFTRIQKAIGADLPTRIVYEDLPIEDCMASIRSRFAARGSNILPFDDLFRTRDRYEIVSIFLALLEMARLRSIRLRQVEPFGEIAVELLPVGETARATAGGGGNEGEAREGDPGGAAESPSGASEGPGAAAGDPGGAARDGMPEESGEEGGPDRAGEDAMARAGEEEVKGPESTS